MSIEEAEVQQRAAWLTAHANFYDRHEPNLAKGLRAAAVVCDSWLAQREGLIRAEESHRRCREVRARLVTGELSDAEAVTEYARATAPLAAAVAALEKP